MCNIIWKDIDWIDFCKGVYQVSNTGLVKRKAGSSFREDGTFFRMCKERILTFFLSRNYRVVKLCNCSKEKSFLIHRLVAIAFIPNPENKPEVNHIDGDPSNNNAVNLEWTTREENLEHARQNNLFAPGKKEGDHSRARKIAMYDLDGRLVKVFLSVISAARFFNSEKSSHIVAACSGKRYTAFCHIFRYVKEGMAVETNLSIDELPRCSLDQINRKKYDIFRRTGAAQLSSKI